MCAWGVCSRAWHATCWALCTRPLHSAPQHAWAPSYFPASFFLHKLQSISIPLQNRLFCSLVLLETAMSLPATFHLFASKSISASAYDSPADPPDSSLRMDWCGGKTDWCGDIILPRMYSPPSIDLTARPVNGADRQCLCHLGSSSLRKTTFLKVGGI